METQGTSLMNVVYCLYWAVSILLIVKVILNNRDSVKTLAWVLVFLFLPFLGFVIYFFFGRDTRRKKMIGKRLRSQLQHRASLRGDSYVQPELPHDHSSLISYFKNAASADLLGASDVRVMLSTKEFASALIEEIDAATEHIHLQFYIIEEDEFGLLLREHLIAKARQGVEVRVIYDSVGCLKVRRDFFETMRCAGVYVESFLKVRFPLFTNKINYRNHRKVVVIDGKVGFVGGCNIADRYVKGVPWGHWRDTMLLVRGAAVHGLQTSFLIDWYSSNRTLVSGRRYFPNLPAGGDNLFQIVQSNPVGEVRTIMSGMVKAIASARSYIYLQTPYFMPNEAFLLALKSAAMSGVDVRLMIPERSDSKVTDYASRSYLADLMNAGVKIYFYTGGFLHSKVFVCDDTLSSVGSVNLDFRSFFYNFEVSAFVYGKGVAQILREGFMNDIEQCRQLSATAFAARPLWQRGLESVARLFSPLL